MYIETLGSCTAVDIYNVTKSYFNDSNLKPCHEMGQFYDKGFDLCSENILSCVAILGAELTFTKTITRIIYYLFVVLLNVFLNILWSCRGTRTTYMH